MKLNEVSMLMLKAIRNNPGDTSRLFYRMGAVPFAKLRSKSIDGSVYLTSGGEWYFRGHRVEVNYRDPDAPVTIEVWR